MRLANEAKLHTGGGGDVSPILFFGTNAISPLLATGILKMDWLGGLRGWQWIFLREFFFKGLSGEWELTRSTVVEGLFTVAVAGVLIFLLPGSPEVPAPLLSPGATRFSAEDQDALTRRLECDDAESNPGAQGLRITAQIVWKTVSHWRRWPHFVSTFAVFSNWSSLTTNTPSIWCRWGGFPYRRTLSLLWVRFLRWGWCLRLHGSVI